MVLSDHSAYSLVKWKKVIAIVDNDASVLRSIARLVTVRGFRTQTFVSAEAFLDCESAAHADCLILDINLGGISGIEMRRRLTAAGSRIPVIFITASDDKDTFRQANEAGCVAYLVKPFVADHLIGAINKAIACAKVAQGIDTRHAGRMLDHAPNLGPEDENKVLTSFHISVASTTSTQDSGLLDHILPLFKAITGIDVRVIAQGTGRALDTGRRGDADVVLVHAKAQEEKFVADGFGVKRYPVMYNDFVLIGPDSNPVFIKGTDDLVAALQAIKAKGAPFISRGDQSGTHIKELDLWKAAGVDTAKDKGHWYKVVGQGMAAALDIASASNAFVLSDRGTWISFKNRRELDIVAQGDHRLFNQYGVILVNPAKNPHVKADLGQAFIDWLISQEGKNAIGGYKIEGQHLFIPNR